MPQDGQNAKFQYALLAAASARSGTEPGLLGEVATRQTGDFWQYAMYAAFACIRTAASRAGIAVRQARQDLDEPPGAITPIISSSSSASLLPCRSADRGSPETVETSS